MSLTIIPHPRELNTFPLGKTVLASLSRIYELKLGTLNLPMRVISKENAVLETTVRWFFPSNILMSSLPFNISVWTYICWCIFMDVTGQACKNDCYNFIFAVEILCQPWEKVKEKELQSPMTISAMCNC